MKEFLLLFRNQVGEGSYSLSPEEMQSTMPKWQDWIGEVIQNGNFVSSQPLDYEGKIVKNKGITDGPYVEAKEILAGYLICKVATIEDAIEISKKCPILDYEFGSIEVRPITSLAIG
ncbi:YciI family protein [Leptospira sp. GIMC2001]|uniref:YciI family protein n=1 Tax=Leptospira sp. GIMC2001 TaxID=1513297 RepID=UPI00234BF5DA|nr:YciI family protein [Leptospira sp. GIMC2001]WCL49911.1 YciI family protein [Leptospira sp. GIMC2001]